jgi:hypothetical protein
MARINKTIDGQHPDASYEAAVALRVSRTRAVFPSLAMRGHSACGREPKAIAEPYRESSLTRTKEEAHKSRDFCAAAETRLGQISVEPAPDESLASDAARATGSVRGHREANSMLSWLL